MREFLKLNKIFSILNVILLCILGYLALNLIGGRIRQVHAENPRSEPVQTNVTPADVSSNALNPEIILERNIFRAVPGSTAAKNSEKEDTETQPAKRGAERELDLRLLGTVAGDEEVACAIVEDAQTSVQDLYKTGDYVQGARVEKIERNRIILLHEGTREILNLYVAGNDNSDSSVLAKETKAAIPENNSQGNAIRVISPSERDVNKKAFLAKIGGIEAVLKTVQITPHTADGTPDGLQITGLEGLSMARFVGLENGDVIQLINGQVVTDSRKAFQVLRKARALPTLDMELLRGSERKTLSFKVQ